jgi:hypothetical protein
LFGGILRAAHGRSIIRRVEVLVAIGDATVPGVMGGRRPNLTV